MLEFPQQKNHEVPLFTEETDIALPETINPKTRYAFFSTIAKGGKSLIKSCVDLHLRRRICYKTLRPEFANSKIENHRLLREARISAMLQHPNIIPTYELGRDSRGHYYFTMKLVHGYTLREILNFRERYDLNQLLEVVLQVAHALAYAHSMGVLHRDIKPDNILVGPYGEVLLLDWGLAKVWSKDKTIDDSDMATDEVEASAGMTGEAKLQGTLLYMSPEQVERKPDISFASDIYSLGAVLYEVVTGVTPFQGDVVYKLLESIRNDYPTNIQSIAKEPITDGLSRLIMGCLNKDPESRPSSIEEIIRIIRAGV